MRVKAHSWKNSHSSLVEQTLSELLAPSPAKPRRDAGPEEQAAVGLSKFEIKIVQPLSEFVTPSTISLTQICGGL